MNPRARWAHTKESTFRSSAWRFRARSRASITLGSALACAIVTSALLLSGSVRALRGALGARPERSDAPMVAESAPHTQPTMRSEALRERTPQRATQRADVALGARVEETLESSVLGATQASALLPRSHGSDSTRGYDATAPPHGRA